MREHCCLGGGEHVDLVVGWALLISSGDVGWGKVSVSEVVEDAPVKIGNVVWTWHFVVAEGLDFDVVR